MPWKRIRVRRIHRSNEARRTVRSGAKVGYLREKDEGEMKEEADAVVVGAAAVPIIVLGRRGGGVGGIGRGERVAAG